MSDLAPAHPPTGRIPRATVARLPMYLQYLESLGGDHAPVSSDEIAAATNLNAAKVRKDLSYLGPTGTRGVGYEVESLRRLILRGLGLTGEVPVAIVGAGNLGSALANYPGFRDRGFSVVALFDVDPKKVGTSIHGHPVRHLDELPASVRRGEIAIAIVATPADAAQSVADRLAQAGVRSILNFAPVVLRVPDGVEVRGVDLSTELQILSFYLARR